MTTMMLPCKVPMKIVMRAFDFFVKLLFRDETPKFCVTYMHGIVMHCSIVVVLVSAWKNSEIYSISSPHTKTSQLINIKINKIYISARAIVVPNFVTIDSLWMPQLG